MSRKPHRAEAEPSLRLASSPSRTFLGDLAYSPYGIGYAGSGFIAFAGHWQDTPDNLYDSPHRLLAPIKEFPQEIPPMKPRWLSPDPAGLAAVNPADPQTWDQYAYAGNQPLEFTDPLGLFTTNPCASPWMCLDPAFWQFEFGLQGAAELGQVSGGGQISVVTVPITGKLQIQGPGCQEQAFGAAANAAVPGQPWATVPTTQYGQWEMQAVAAYGGSPEILGGTLALEGKTAYRIGQIPNTFEANGSISYGPADVNSAWVGAGVINVGGVEGTYGNLGAKYFTGSPLDNIETADRILQWLNGHGGPGHYVGGGAAAAARLQRLGELTAMFASFFRCLQGGG